MLRFADKSMTVLPFFLLNGELSSSSNTDLATPTAERSGLARTSTLPSLLHTPAGIGPWPQGTSLIPLSTYSLSALCPLSVAAWVILSLRSCLYAVTGKSFQWCSKLRRSGHTVTLTSYSGDAYRNAWTIRHKNKRSDRRESKTQYTKDHFKIWNPVMQTFLSKQQLQLLTERRVMLKQRETRTRSKPNDRLMNRQWDNHPKD